MKHLIFIMATLSLLLAAVSSSNAAPAPNIITYQGSMFVDDQPFDGAGFFKVAIVDASGETLWSNDGTSISGSEPEGEITVQLNEGLFFILLGDTNIPGMEETIDPSIFNTTETLYLKSWFDDGEHGSSELTPKIRITSAAYALNAQLLQGLAPGNFLQVTDQITSSQIAAGAVESVNIAGGAVNTAQISYKAVTAEKLAAFSDNNTALTLGRGQDDNITVYANTSAGDDPALRYNMGDNKWEVSDDGTTWTDIGGANKTLSNLTDSSVAINTSLVSDFTNTDDLGSPNIEWKDLYLSSAIRLGETAAPTKKGDKGFLYVKDDGGNTELYYEDNKGNEVQITDDGSVASGASSAFGTYTGQNGVQTITIGWQPTHIYIADITANAESNKNDSMPNDDYMGNGTWTTNKGITIISDGFRVGGNGTNVNVNGNTYYWTAWR